MLGYFKDRNSFQVPALLFLTIAFKLVYIRHPQFQPINSEGGLLPAWLSQSIIPRLDATFIAVLALLVQFFSAIFANYLLSSSRMFGRSNFFVALSMIMFTSLFPSSNQLSATTLLLPWIIILFRQITRLYNNQKFRPIIINIGLIFGVGYLLYHPFIWLLPCCFFGLASMRAFRLPEWLLLIVGIITPLYFLLAYEFLTDQWNPASHLISWNYYRTVPKVGMYSWISLGVASAWLLAGIVEWQGQIRRMLIQSRKNWNQLILIGIFILPMAILPAGNVTETITLLSFPAGSLASNAFARERTTPSLILFWLIIVTIAVVGWAYVH